MMKMLVPVDGSPASANALKKAIEIARDYNFSVKVVTVVSSQILRKSKRDGKLWHLVDGSIIAGKSTLDSSDVESFLKRFAETTLDSVFSEMDMSNIQIEREILFGEPYEEILELAKKEKFDLIVIANRGYSSIKQFFIGSIAQRVISEARCPVLVIHFDKE